MVRKAVFHSSPFVTQILLHSYLTLILEHIWALDLAIVWITLSIRGKEYLFPIV